MLKVAYAPRFTDLGCRYDYGFYKPLQELANTGIIDLKVFLPYQIFGQPLKERRAVPNAIGYSLLRTERNLLAPPLSAIESLNARSNLINALNSFQPDVVISHYNVSKMKCDCKKIWICQEYWPHSMVEFLNKTSYHPLIDLATRRIDELLVSFDYALSPSKLACAHLQAHKIKVKRIDIFLDTGDNTIIYGEKKLILLSAKPDGWFRYPLVMKAVRPLIQAIESKPNIELYQSGGTFDTQSVACGIAPSYYQSSEPSKVYSYLAYGIPSLTLNYEDMDEEMGVYPYSVENVIRCIEEDWRSKESDHIFNSFKIKHGLDRLTKEWLDFLNLVSS